MKIFFFCFLFFSNKIKFILGENFFDYEEENSKKLNLFCSISSKWENFYGLTHFTYDKIPKDLCTHLLIDFNNSILFNLTLYQFKIIDSNLKIILTININNFNFVINKLNEYIIKKYIHGINIYIDQFSNNTIYLIQVC